MGRVTDRFVGKPRHHTHEPIVPMQDGRPPAFVVVCLTDGCDFAHDAHGLTAEDAVKSVAPTHASGHQLIARSVDYTAGWRRPGQPLAGIAASEGPHGLYGP
jgi:hypothetical protein